MKILVLTSRFPYPLEKGDKLRIYHAIKGLSEKHEIHLFAITSEEVSSQDYAHLQQFLASCHIEKITPIKRLINAGKALLTSRMPLQTGWIYARDISRNVLAFAEKVNPDVVFIQLARMAEHGRRLPHPKVLDYMDTFSVGMKKRAEIANWVIKPLYIQEAKRIKSYEENVYRDFDKTTIISHQDKRLLTFSCDDMEILPNGVDTEYFSRHAEHAIYDVGFIGNLGYLPNIEAVKYIYQHLFKNNPGWKYLICGARPPKEIQRLYTDHFTVKGWIPDIREAYAQVRVFVAPIFSGTGQQNKILEAMAMGIPCITSTTVNNSIGATPNREILIADTAEEYKEKLSLLINNDTLYKNISKQAGVFVRDNFTWSKHVRQLEKILLEAKEKYESRKL